MSKARGVSAMLFTGGRVWTVSEDNTIYIWDVVRISSPLLSGLFDLTVKNWLRRKRLQRSAAQ